MSRIVTRPPVPALTDAVAAVEADLRHRLEAVDLPAPLADAVRYAVLGPGKRLRPALVLLGCEAAGGDRADALAAAGAIELIHTFSLVHDDLPAMDDDALRRGRPTLHVHAGEAMAILAGDALHALAFAWLADPRLDERRVGALTAELAGATTRMIAGQVLDTLGGFEPHHTDLERLHLIHRNKTGALIRAACRLGGICADADRTAPATYAALTDYGDSVGLMFQIVDDLLDVTQSTEHLGKAAGKDQSAGKLTSPGLLGVEATRREIERLRGVATAAAARLGAAGGALAELSERLAVRTR
ncbi:MAG: polyprenyl synthetase family protein [Planctomycetota bacterium]